MKPLKILKSVAKASLGFRTANDNRLQPNNPMLINIFLRGGADGLSIVAPYGDDGYYRNRVVTAIPAPETASAKKLLKLDDFFGLHPSLSPLFPFYCSGEMGFVHACGSGDRTLSHFAATNTMEHGLLQGQDESSGWLTRFLDVSAPVNSYAMRAVAIGALLPASLEGASCAIAIQNLSDLTIRNPFKSGNVGLEFTLNRLYSGRDVMSEAGQQTLKLIEILKRSSERSTSTSRAYGDDDLGNGLKQVAQLAKDDVGLAVACIDQNGYDTHVFQGGTEGILSDCLKSLARSITAFVADIGRERWLSTKIVVMSEFGRRVRENDGAGTDHGHGSVMMVLGGAGVKGGQVYCQWPGLSGTDLDENGNLKSTTDYRSVLAEVLSNQVSLASATTTIFSGLRYGPVGIAAA